MTNSKILTEIKKYISDMIDKYGDKVPPEELDAEGAVYYTNGNDGTHFDFYVNGRTCEFEVFYKNGLGFCKAYLCADGYLRGYLWNNKGKADGIKLDDRKLTSAIDAEIFAVWLTFKRDLKGIWDEII